MNLKIPFFQLFSPGPYMAFWLTALSATTGLFFLESDERESGGRGIEGGGGGEENMEKQSIMFSNCDL